MDDHEMNLNDLALEVKAKEIIREKGNEGANHTFLKKEMFKALSCFGCKDFKEEVSHGGLRFDLVGSNPDGTKLIVEIGELNCRMVDVWKRLRKCYDLGYDVWIWCPYSVDSRSQFMDFFDYFLIGSPDGAPDWRCRDCFRERNVANRGHMITMPLSRYETSAFVFDLRLVFDDVHHEEFHQNAGNSGYTKVDK